LSWDVNITACSYNKKYSHVWMKYNLNSPCMISLKRPCQLYVNNSAVQQYHVTCQNTA